MLISRIPCEAANTNFVNRPKLKFISSLAKETNFPPCLDPNSRQLDPSIVDTKILRIDTRKLGQNRNFFRWRSVNFARLGPPPFFVPPLSFIPAARTKLRNLINLPEFTREGEKRRERVADATKRDRGQVLCDGGLSRTLLHRLNFPRQ